MTQVQADMNIMFENAKSYNRVDSDLYKWAVKLQKVVQNKVQELLNEEDSSNDDSPSAKGTTADSGNDVISVESPADSSRESSKTPGSSGKKTGTKGKGVTVGLSSPTGTPKAAKEIPPEKSKLEMRKDLLKQRFMSLYKTLLDVKVCG